MADRSGGPPPAAPTRGTSADLAVVAGVALLAAAAPFLPGVRESVLRAVLALPLVLFLPGYAVLAALHPERRVTETGRTWGPARAPRLAAGIRGDERLGLAVGGSVTLVPLVALVLSVTPVGLAFGPVLASLAGVTVLAAFVAAVRRRLARAD